MKATKISKTEISVTKQITVEQTNTFTLKQLRAQKKAIKDQKDRDNAQRDAEIAEVNELIAQCIALETEEETEEIN